MSWRPRPDSAGTQQVAVGTVVPGPGVLSLFIYYRVVAATGLCQSPVEVEVTAPSSSHGSRAPLCARRCPGPLSLLWFLPAFAQSASTSGPGGGTASVPVHGVEGHAARRGRVTCQGTHRAAGRVGTPNRCFREAHALSHSPCTTPSRGVPSVQDPVSQVCPLLCPPRLISPAL